MFEAMLRSRTPCKIRSGLSLWVSAFGRSVSERALELIPFVGHGLSVGVGSKFENLSLQSVTAVGDREPSENLWSTR